MDLNAAVPMDGMEKNTAEDELGWVTVKQFMNRYNCGRNRALKYMNDFPGTVKLAGKLQIPVVEFENHIREEAARQRAEFPHLVPEV